METGGEGQRGRKMTQEVRRKMEKRRSKLDGCRKERRWDQLGVPPESASAKGLNHGRAASTAAPEVRPPTRPQ